MKKLLSLNIGVTIEYEDEQGKEQKMSLTGIFPSKMFPRPWCLFYYLFDELNKLLGTSLGITGQANDEAIYSVEKVDSVSL